MAAETDIQQSSKEKEFWRDSEFSPLINHEDLRKVTKDDPWQYEVASRLKNFLLRMESRKIVNFHVSGIVLHSASVLCRAKSQTMVDKGTEIQDALANRSGQDGHSDADSSDQAESETDDAGVCTINELAFDGDGNIKPEAIASGTVDIDKVLDMIASGKGNVA
nr:hypothetical protein [Candidatus Sigynarchaeota archaeon]